MTTEEKAKAYDKALERAKKQLEDAKIFDYNDGQIAYDIRTTTYAIFPELEESGDERIRKVLVAIVKWLGFDSSFFTDSSVTKSEVLAYLEKQKINTEGDFGRGYDCGYEACLNSHGAEFFEKQKEQKEQKPEEWNEEDEKIRKSIIWVLEVTYPSYREEIDWLKSLSFKPHWKPSEEQIAALKEVINQDLNVCCGDIEWVTESLEDLLDDLKKL